MMALWSTTAEPERTVPSTAIFSPVCASMRSPALASAMGHRSRLPSSFTRHTLPSSTESICLMEERVFSMV